MSSGRFGRSSENSRPCLPARARACSCWRGSGPPTVGVLPPVLLTAASVSDVLWGRALRSGPAAGSGTEWITALELQRGRSAETVRRWAGRVNDRAACPNPHPHVETETRRGRDLRPPGRPREARPYC